MDVVLLAIGLGVVAGVLAGLFGVGGGILFVPTLTLGLGLTQLHAEASSLLAIIPTVAAGTWRQQRYGNVRWRPAIVIGLAAVGGVEGGVVVAEHLPGARAQAAVRSADDRRRRAGRLACVAPRSRDQAASRRIPHNEVP